MSNNIIECFPNHLKPRDVQRNALLKLQKQWNDANIFVVNLPVASGKSAIAMTIARWAKKASIVTPSNILVDQYIQEYPKLQVLKGQKQYHCDTFGHSVYKTKMKQKRLCPAEIGCDGCDQYRKDLRRSRVYPHLLSNYYTYFAHKLYRPNLIIDEGHNLIPTLQEMASKKLWQFKFRYPSDIRTREDILRWLSGIPEHIKQKSQALQTLEDDLMSDTPAFLIQITSEPYLAAPHNGEKMPLIKMVPLDIRSLPEGGYMWPSSVKKIIIMSATIGKKDIEQLGLAGRKVCYISADSVITADRRPVYADCEFNMSYKYQQDSVPKLAKYLLAKAFEHPTEKGMVHATYSVARMLRELLQGTEEGERFMFHDKHNKRAVYEEFRADPKPRILIASGLYEGVDLPYDLGRWQVIAKVPWPSLAEPAVRYKCDSDPAFYAWETIKTVLQACGRICRTPTDYGRTYIPDQSFRRLYNQNPDMFPEWFRNSVRLGE